MKEYIFARPDVVTLKEAMHDAYFRGELIRCKDCENELHKRCSFHDIDVDDNDYCSRAERKEK